MVKEKKDTFFIRVLNNRTAYVFYLLLPLIFSTLIFSLLFISHPINQQNIYSNHLENHLGDYIFLEEGGSLCQERKYETNNEFMEEYKIEHIQYLHHLEANTTINGSSSHMTIMWASTTFYELFFNVSLLKNQFMISSIDDPFSIGKIIPVKISIGSTVQQTTNLSLTYWPHTNDHLSYSDTLNYFIDRLKITPTLFLTTEIFEEIFVGTDLEDIKIVYWTIFDFQNDYLVKYRPRKASEILEQTTFKLKRHLESHSQYYTAYIKMLYNDLFSNFMPKALYKSLRLADIYGENTPIPSLYYISLILCLGFISLLLKRFSEIFNEAQKDKYAYFLIKGGRKQDLMKQTSKNYLMTSSLVVFICLIIEFSISFLIWFDIFYSWGQFIVYIFTLLICSNFLIMLVQFRHLIRTFSYNNSEVENNTFIKILVKDSLGKFLPGFGIIMVGTFTTIFLFANNIIMEGLYLLIISIVVTILVLITALIYIFLRNYLQFFGVLIAHLVSSLVKINKYIRYTFEFTLRKTIKRAWIIVLFSLIISVPLLSIDSFSHYRSRNVSLNQFYDVTIEFPPENTNYVNFFLNNMTQEKIDVYLSKHIQLVTRKVGWYIETEEVHGYWFFLNITDIDSFSSQAPMKNYKGLKHDHFPKDLFLNSNKSCIINKKHAELTNMKANHEYTSDFVTGSKDTFQTYQTTYNISIADIGLFIPFFSWLMSLETSKDQNMLLTTTEFESNFTKVGLWSTYRHILLPDNISKNEFSNYLNFLNNKYQLDITLLDFGDYYLYQYLHPYATPEMIIVQTISLSLGVIFVSIYIILYAKQNLDELYSKLSILYSKGLKSKQGIMLSSLSVTLMVIVLNLVSFIFSLGMVKFFLIISKRKYYNIPLRIHLFPLSLTFVSIMTVISILLVFVLSFIHYLHTKERVQILTLSEQSKTTIMELVA